MSNLFRIIRLFNQREQLKFAGLSLLLLIGSLIEVIGIGLILPFTQIVGNPQSLLNDAYIGPLFESLHLEGDRELIIAASVGMVGVFIFRSAYVAIHKWIHLRFVYNQSIKLAYSLLKSYLHKPYTFHLQRNTADLIRNVNIEVGYVAATLRLYMEIWNESMITVGLMSLLIWSNPFVSIAGFFAIAVIGMVVAGLVRHRLDWHGKVQVEQRGRMIQWVNQSVSGIKEVKVSGQVSYFADAFRKSMDRFANSLLKGTLIVEYGRIFVEMALILTFVGVVASLVLLGTDPKVIFPTLALFGMALVRMVPSINRVVQSINQIRFTKASVDAVYDDLYEGLKVNLRVPETLNADPLPFETSLDVDDLTYVYPNTRVPAIRTISLTIRHGQTVAFVGPSGAGKTTLLNLILGLLRPTEGSIRVDGTNIYKAIDQWQRVIGYIPQDIYLSDDTIRRNVAFGIPDVHIHDEDVWRALEAAQLRIFVNGLEEGLDTVVGENGIRISAGQRQRIGIARALYRNPDILVLDEATSSLDTQTERKFSAAIEAFRGKKTLIIIAHRLSTVQHSDKIFVIESGKLVGSGTYTALLSTNPVFQQLVQSSEADARSSATKIMNKRKSTGKISRLI